MYQPMYIDVYIRIKITFLLNFSVTVAQHYLRVPGCPENHLCDVIWTKIWEYAIQVKSYIYINWQYESPYNKVS